VIRNFQTASKSIGRDIYELMGPVERLRSSFVGGIKHMPVLAPPLSGLVSYLSSPVNWP
jgi:hypothetical protein